MSRIGRKPINIPPGVEIKTEGAKVVAKGPLGSLEWNLVRGIWVEMEDGALHVKRENDQPKVKALHGLVRAELSNMIHGVTQGYERTLELTGVGYRAQVQGQTVTLTVGYTHPVEVTLPEGVLASVEKQTNLMVKGIDKRKVSQTAANIRGVKPPDVYKQKGIKYAGEALRKKAGKTGK